MKLIPFITIFSLFCVVSTQAQPIKVACVGDSITLGTGIPGAEANSYPAQLQKIPGEGFDVKIFASESASISPDPPSPYVATPQFKEAMKFLPDVVLINLGTYDSRPQPWSQSWKFRIAYQDMISQFRALPSKPMIWLVKPVPAFKSEDKGINATIIEEEILPLVDGILPNAEGAGEMAKIIAPLLQKYRDQAPPPPSRVSYPPAENGVIWDDAAAISRMSSGRIPATSLISMVTR